MVELVQYSVAIFLINLRINKNRIETKKLMIISFCSLATPIQDVAAEF